MTLKVVYWLESDKKGIMDTKWHDQVIEHTWAKARARHRELVKQFMEDGWQEKKWTYHGRGACRYPGGQSRRCADHPKNRKAAGRSPG